MGQLRQTAGSILKAGAINASPALVVCVLPAEKDT